MILRSAPNEDAMQSVGSMQAVRYQSYGSPDVLENCTLPLPIISEREVLVRVRFSSVNRTDCGFLRASPPPIRFVSGLFRPKYEILGCEFSGDVVEVGSQVSDFKTGDRVFGFKDDNYGLGGHAQYTAMSCDGMLQHIPASVSYADAAAGLEGSHYALSSIRATNISERSRVLINGTTGAIGSAAVQIVAAMGAHITAVCAGEYKEKVLSLGADSVIDYLTEDFTKIDDQFDVVFDAVGKSRFSLCKRLLKLDGIYTSSELGPYCENPLLALTTKIGQGKKVVFPIPSNLKSDAQHIADLMQQGKFKPLVDRTYPLSEVADAFRYVETGMKTGNVLIEIP
jgi:NADPH:quinone reductase-like Zn-dependent oxidoreductase